MKLVFDDDDVDIKMIPLMKHMKFERVEMNQLILRYLNTFISCTAAENIDNSKNLLNNITYKLCEVNTPTHTVLFQTQSYDINLLLNPYSSLIY